MAAAMHDYDHPGRTNAFLVATNAPQVTCRRLLVSEGLLRQHGSSRTQKHAVFGETKEMGAAASAALTLCQRRVEENTLSSVEPRPRPASAPRLRVFVCSAQ